MYRVLRHFRFGGIKFIRGDVVADNVIKDPKKLVRAKMLAPVAEAYRFVHNVADAKIGDEYLAKEIEAWPTFRALFVNGHIEPCTIKPKKPVTKKPLECSVCGREFLSKRGLAAHISQAHGDD